MARFVARFRGILRDATGQNVKLERFGPQKVEHFGTLWNIGDMAQYSVPSNTGKVRVAMFLGGKFAVWNGKHGKDEFRIICKTRKQAAQVAGIINRREHDGTIEVLG